MLLHHVCQVVLLEEGPGFSLSRRVTMVRGADAILLTKGDNVVNSIRYLQRCEGERLDVRVVR